MASCVAGYSISSNDLKEKSQVGQIRAVGGKSYLSASDKVLMILSLSPQSCTPVLSSISFIKAIAPVRQGSMLQEEA